MLAHAFEGRADVVSARLVAASAAAASAERFCMYSFVHTRAGIVLALTPCRCSSLTSARSFHSA
jgi:hypothetical protein